MGSFLQKIDIVSPNPARRIHFSDNAPHKTAYGGICSLLVISSFLIIACV